MVGSVLLAAVLPVLGARGFYLAGDSAAAWLPAGRRIGDLLLAGESHLMDPTAWRGGNFVAEAGHGLWNPVVLLLDATVLQLDDLAVAATIVKAVYMLILSVGVYLLAREYGATAWPSALAGLAVPVAGFTLWMDAATWTPNLVSFAFFPFVWLTARRLGRDAGGPIWLVLAGALCVSAGNPYSNVIVGVVVIGVAIEQWLQRSERALARAVALGLSLTAIALLAVFVYLPFRETSSVGFRETVVSNDETFAPGLENLVGLSSPTMTPLVDNFGTPLLKFPATYLAWFILPLAPWLRWRKIIDGWRRFGGSGRLLWHVRPVVAGAVQLLVLPVADPARAVRLPPVGHRHGRRAQRRGGDRPSTSTRGRVGGGDRRPDVPRLVRRPRRGSLAPGRCRARGRSGGGYGRDGRSAEGVGAVHARCDVARADACSCSFARRTRACATTTHRRPPSWSTGSGATTARCC